MSDEQRKDEEAEVEAHKHRPAYDQPTESDDENEVEAHKHRPKHRANIRLD